MLQRAVRRGGASLQDVAVAETASSCIGTVAVRSPQRYVIVGGCRSRSGRGGVGLGRVIANDDGFQDREDRVAGHADTAGMLADRFGIPCLINADRAEGAVRFLDHVAAN